MVLIPRIARLQIWKSAAKLLKNDYKLSVSKHFDTDSLFKISLSQTKLMEAILLNPSHVEVEKMRQKLKIISWQFCRFVVL
jgi:hypothetical protein